MSEALTPEEIARKIKRAGIGKAKFDFTQTSILGIMAGAFIALGGVFALTIAVSPELGTGPARLLIGVGFSLGLFLVVVTGSELFTGNNLMVASFFSRRISGPELTRNWTLAFVANLVGSLVIVFLLYFSQWWAQADYAFSVRTIQIANDKVNLSFGTAFVRGLLANMLVCLAVWMAVAGRSLVDKMIGIILPITAFVAAGFEHSIANMFFLPLGWLVSTDRRRPGRRRTDQRRDRPPQLRLDRPQPRRRHPRQHHRRRPRRPHQLDRLSETPVAPTPRLPRYQIVGRFGLVVSLYRQYHCIQVYLDFTKLGFAGSALRHGIARDDALHACRNAIRIVHLDDLLMFVGADRSGRMLEVGVARVDEAHKIIHAMPARPNYLR